MSFWIVLQLILNIGLLVMGLVIWARLSRPQKDDPRMSRGLQLLQNKIAILEDLSDRTDVQVKQLAQLLEQKSKDLDEKILKAEELSLKMETSAQKGLEITKMFLSKEPHKEIIERQNTLKYIQAAKMAHQGLSADEISKKVDIPIAELEFIVKVNKDRLVFSEESLPGWVRESLSFSDEEEKSHSNNLNPILARSIHKSFENTDHLQANLDNMKKIEMEFRKTVEDHNEKLVASQTTDTKSNSSDVSTAVTEAGAIETGLESNLNSDLKSNIQKAKDFISKTFDKTLEVKKNNSFIKKEDSHNVKPYKFRKIEKDF